MSIYKDIQLYIQITNIDIEKIKKEATSHFMLLHENYMIMLEYNDCIYKTKISWKHDEKRYLHDIFLIPYQTNKNECYLLLYDINKKIFSKKLIKKIRCAIHTGQLQLCKMDCFEFIMGNVFYDYEKYINTLQQQMFTIKNKDKEKNSYISGLEKKNRELETKLNLIKNVLI